MTNPTQEKKGCTCPPPKPYDWRHLEGCPMLSSPQAEEFCVRGEETSPRENWENQEPWISIEGVLYDLLGGVTSLNAGRLQIKGYVDTLLLQEKERLIEEINKLMNFEIKGVTFVSRYGVQEIIRNK